MREEDMTTALIPALHNAPLSAGNLEGAWKTRTIWRLRNN